MDETTTKLILQWIALGVAVMFFVVSAVKWSRGLTIAMFGLCLFHVGTVAENYGFETFSIMMVALIPSGIGGFIFFKEQKKQRSAPGREHGQT